MAPVTLDTSSGRPRGAGARACLSRRAVALVHHPGNERPPDVPLSGEGGARTLEAP
jgi:hypothetical protein